MIPTTMMPLEGIRVLDLTRLAPGPFCTMLLGDLGADVIVVEEAPGAGRRFDVGLGDRAQAFNALGRNKRSIGLNLKDEAARQVFYRLAEKADVVLEGFRPGVVKRLGVDYETVSAINPRIVYCSLSGYGQTGTYASLAGPPARPPREHHRGLRRRRPVRRLRHSGGDHRPREDRPRPVRRHGDERRRDLAGDVPRQHVLQLRPRAGPGGRAAQRRLARL